MKRWSIALAILIVIPILGIAHSAAQSMDDLNLQVHGYATQGFIYSTNNNWNTTDSTDGSAAWTEAVVNLTALPQPKLRIGVQARYFLLGNFGKAITLDWAQADYKVNEKFGFRVGKVKTPLGQFNETQDIDPALLWVLLPQSIYPLSSRNSLLCHNGGVVYGRISLGESLGKIEYRAFGGQRVMGPDDGFVQPFKDQGMTLPDGFTGPMFGGTLRWNTPLQGLTVGATIDAEHTSGPVSIGPLSGTMAAKWMKQPPYFGRYERNKLMLAGEYNRIPIHGIIQLAGAPPITIREDVRSFYAMASYKPAEKLTAGLYYSSFINLPVPVSTARYEKDWAVAARYDFNPFLYLKLEQHIIDGTAVGFSTSDNADGLRPNTRMTLLKLGMSF